MAQLTQHVSLAPKREVPHSSPTKAAKDKTDRFDGFACTFTEVTTVANLPGPRAASWHETYRLRQIGTDRRYDRLLPTIDLDQVIEFPAHEPLRLYGPSIVQWPFPREDPFPVHEPFSFDSIDGGIRLCEIKPVYWSQQIHCTLTTYYLNGAPPYLCLSYAWGGAKDPWSIAINGKKFEVAENLHSALHRLRETGMRSHVWIDALCINQKDEYEKTGQVSRMGDIFAGADKVLVWLGEPQLGLLSGYPHMSISDVASEVLSILGMLGDNKHIHELGYDHTCHSLNCPFPFGSFGGRDWDRGFLSLKSWMSSSWFTRTWTIQEIVLAKDAVAMCGESCITWNPMAEAWNNFAHHMQTCCADCVFALTT